MPSNRVAVSHPAANIALVMAAIGLAWLVSRHVLYPALHVPESAPVILRPILGFLTAWALVKRDGASWSDYGLRRPPSIAWLVAWTVVAIAVTWVAGTFLAPPLAAALHPEPRPSFFGYIHGNAVALAGWIAISWVVGGLCEELLFRGYLLSQVSRLLPTRAAGAVLGLLAQALLFGVLHLYQGAFGFVFATVAAVMTGAVYLANGRNLWPLVIAHAAVDTFSFVAIYR